MLFRSNRTPIRRLKWQTPFEALNGTQPTIDHLCVFGCGAYVHIPCEVRKNKLAPKSELMTYLGVAPGGHGSRFMHAPNNVLFTAMHALFDEHMFPKCDKTVKRRNTRLHEPAPQTDQSPIPMDDDDEPPRRQPQPLPNKGKGKECDDAQIGRAHV